MKKDMGHAEKSASVGPYSKIPLPNYEVVPLKRDEIVVAAAQLMTQPVDARNPKPGIKQNVDRMCWLIDCAFAWQPVKKHLICFPEFSLQGIGFDWTREDWLRVSIEVPGEEIEPVCRKAVEHNCYIELACHTRDAAWPGHFFNTALIIDPRGEVIYRHWKAHCDPGSGEYATTVHDVLDEFVERHGWDAVWPVARTDIGNLSAFICSEGFQPETARMFAFKGAEILIYSCSGCAYTMSELAGASYDPRLSMRAYGVQNNTYGIFANNAESTEGPAYNKIGAGHSMIIDNRGRVLTEAELVSETVVADRIPVETFRKRRSIPVLRQELYYPGYRDHAGKYPSNMYAAYQPADFLDAIRWAREQARW